MLKIRLSDSLTHEPIDGRVYITVNNKDLVDGRTAGGACGFEIPAGPVITVRAEVDGFMPVTEEVNSATVDQITLEMKLLRIEEGKSVILHNIQFERGKYNLLESSYPDLGKIVNMMNQYPKMEIEVQGHTDNSGDPKKNKELSINRAKAVKSYLVSKEIKAPRISPVGYGGAKPVASNKTEETKKLNRRVEIKIIKMK
jgi:outer membrane protein OmpA-like peptidoglycan-associated protein